MNDQIDIPFVAINNVGLEVKNVTKSYDNKRVLNNVSVNLNRGEYIDFYGKVENFEEDMNYVASKIGLEIQNIPWKNKAVKKDYREYYNNETIKIVEEIYQKDIEAFGYTFDGQK